MTRLATLSPRALCSVVRLNAREHCEALCAALGTTAATLPTKTPIEEQIEALVAFAQSGAWNRPEAVKDALQSVYNALYRSASTPRLPMPREWLAQEYDTLALVARACLARVAIAAGENVPRHWLRTLGDVSEKTIRNTIERGELEDVEGERLRSGGAVERPILNQSAKTWLVRQGVVGVGE